MHIVADILRFANLNKRCDMEVASTSKERVDCAFAREQCRVMKLERELMKTVPGGSVME